MSTKSGMAGVEIEYAIVKDYCEKYSLDVIDTFGTLRRIVAEVYKK